MKLGENKKKIIKIEKNARLNIMITFNSFCKQMDSCAISRVVAGAAAVDHSEVITQLEHVLNQLQESQLQSGQYTMMMIKLRHGWFTNPRLYNLLCAVIERLVNCYRFTSLEHGLGFTSVSIPPKTYAFYRFHNHYAVDAYPSPDDLLMSTHPGSQSITGFMVSW